MVDRLLKVNAYTTLDYVEAEVEGHELADEAPAVLNVTADRHDPDHVELALELDDALDAVPHHVDRVPLSPAQARAIATDLEKYADRVEAASDDDGAVDGDVEDAGDADGGDAADVDPVDDGDADADAASAVEDADAVETADVDAAASE